MTQQQTRAGHPGLDALVGRALLEVLWRRRTHRVSRGSSVRAGTISYEPAAPREPLTDLEAVLTGCTGLTMPDRPLTTSCLVSGGRPSSRSGGGDHPVVPAGRAFGAR